MLTTHQVLGAIPFSLMHSITLTIRMKLVADLSFQHTFMGAHASLAFLRTVSNGGTAHCCTPQTLSLSLFCNFRKSIKLKLNQLLSLPPPFLSIISHNKTCSSSRCKTEIQMARREHAIKTIVRAMRQWKARRNTQRRLDRKRAQRKVRTVVTIHRLSCLLLLCLLLIKSCTSPIHHPLASLTGTFIWACASSVISTHTPAAF